MQDVWSCKYTFIVDIIGDVTIHLIGFLKMIRSIFGGVPWTYDTPVSDFISFILSNHLLLALVNVDARLRWLLCHLHTAERVPCIVLWYNILCDRRIGNT